MIEFKYHKTERVSSNRALLVLLLVAFSLIGCVDGLTGPFLTSDDFLEESETTSYMRDMAVSIGKIEDAPIAGLDVAQTRSVILEELENIRTIASQINFENETGSKGPGANAHKQIYSDLTRLRDELDKAIVRLNTGESSDLYVAGKIVGPCLACHEHRQGSLLPLPPGVNMTN